MTPYMDPYEPSTKVKAESGYKNGSNWVFQQLKALTASGTAYELIGHLEFDCDGRDAWITLCRFYESAGASTVRKIEARKVISDLKFNGESRRTTFQHYVSKHIWAAVTLSEAGEPISNEHHKEQFIANITYSALKEHKPHAKNNIAMMMLRQLAHFFQGKLAKLGAEEGALENRNARHTNNKPKSKSTNKGKGKPKDKRARKANFTKGKDRSNGGSKKGRDGKLPPEVWKQLTQEMCDKIIKTSRKARAAKRDSNNSDNNDSSDDNESAYMKNRTTKLVGTKLALKGTGEPKKKKVTMESNTDGATADDTTVKMSNVTTNMYESDSEDDESLSAGARFGRAAMFCHANMMSTMRYETYTND